MTGDRERGVRVLQLYYNQVPSLMTTMSFEQLLAYYDSQGLGKNVELLGGAARDADFNDNVMSMVLGNLAEQTPSGKAPDLQSFFAVMAGEVTAFHFSDVTAALAQGIKDTAGVVTTAAAIGVSVYALWMIGGLLAVYLLSRARRA